MMNCIPNRIALEKTFDMGVVSLGKYTFPKTPAFAVNVLALPVKQLEKKDQIAVPGK